MFNEASLPVEVDRENRSEVLVGCPMTYFGRREKRLRVSCCQSVTQPEMLQELCLKWAAGSP